MGRYGLQEEKDKGLEAAQESTESTDISSGGLGRFVGSIFAYHLDVLSAMIESCPNMGTIALDVAKRWQPCPTRAIAAPFLFF